MIRIPDALARVYGAEVTVTYWPSTETPPPCELHNEHPVPPATVEFVTDGVRLHICEGEHCEDQAFLRAMTEWDDAHAVNRSVRIEVSVPAVIQAVAA